MGATVLLGEIPITHGLLDHAAGAPDADPVDPYVPDPAQPTLVPLDARIVGGAIASPSPERIPIVPPRVRV